MWWPAPVCQFYILSLRSRLHKALFQGKKKSQKENNRRKEKITTTLTPLGGEASRKNKDSLDTAHTSAQTFPAQGATQSDGSVGTISQPRSLHVTESNAPSVTSDKLHAERQQQHPGCHSNTPTALAIILRCGENICLLQKAQQNSPVISALGRERPRKVVFHSTVRLRLARVPGDPLK